MHNTVNRVPLLHTNIVQICREITCLDDGQKINNYLKIASLFK